MNIIEKYLQEKNLKYKEVNGQFNLLEGCPVCKDPKPNHFY